MPARHVVPSTAVITLVLAAVLMTCSPDRGGGADRLMRSAFRPGKSVRRDRPRHLVRGDRAGLQPGDPETGFLHFIFTAFFYCCCGARWPPGPNRSRLLRSLAVLFGGAFVLKYVVLGSDVRPERWVGQARLATLLEGATLGGLQYEPPAASDRLPRVFHVGPVHVRDNAYRLS